MLKSKKRLVIVLVIVGVFAALLILGSALFSLRQVTIEYRTTGATNITQYSKDKIIKAGEFKYGSNILFLDYSKNISRIEAAFPYVKVVGTEAKFPNSVIVYITERDPAFRFSLSAGGWAVADAEFKVLRVVSNESELTSAELTLPIWTNFSKTSATAGSFMSSSNEQTLITAISRALSDDDVNLDVSILSTITLNENDGEFDSEIVLDNGVTIRIYGLNNLANKMLFAFNHYQEVIEPSGEDLSTKVITITKNFDGLPGSYITS